MCPKRILSHTIRMAQPIDTQLQRVAAQLLSEDGSVLPMPEKVLQSHGYSVLKNGSTLIFKWEKLYDQGLVSSRMSTWYK